MDTENWDPWHRHPANHEPANPEPPNSEPENLHPSGQPRRPRWSGRTKRILTTSGVGAVLLGTGAAIGIALTGGASAAVSQGGTPAASTSASTPATTTSPGTPASRCARIVNQALNSNHDKLAARLHAFCTRPLLRLALVGGEHGTVTFRGKAGPRTVSFERGTVQSDTQSSTGTVITVQAADGTTMTWDITSSTVIRQAGSKVASSAIGDGDKVFVGGTVVNGANDAALIRIAKSA
jgi:hypothetical protein